MNDALARGPIHYSHDGLEFDLPAGWQVDTDSGGAAPGRVLCCKPPCTGLLTMQMLSAEGDTDLATFARAFSQSVRDQAHGASGSASTEPDASTFSALADADGCELLLEKFTTHWSGYSVPLMRVWSRKALASVVLVVMCLGAEEDLHDLQSELAHLVCSMRLAAPPAAPQ